MPKMVLNQRQRERAIKRTWSPVAPEFLTYSYGGQVFTRTYTPTPHTYNVVETGVDATPYGFYFMPTPIPPLVPLYGQVTLDTFAVIGGALNQIGSLPTPLIPVPDATTNPTTSKTLLLIDGYPLSVGVTSTPLKTTAFVVQRATILAASGNTGTLYISGSKGNPAGQGFPLVAGSAKDIGEPDDSKGVDLSSVYLIGTNSADQAFIEYER